MGRETSKHQAEVSRGTVLLQSEEKENTSMERSNTSLWRIRDRLGK